MKTIKYIIIPVLVWFSLQSCENQILDKEPLDIISDATVWDDITLTNAYVANLYGRIKIPSTFVGPLNQAELIGDEAFLCDDATTRHTWASEWNKNFIFGSLDAKGGLKEYWDYDLIRACNVFLEKIVASKISESIKTQLSAEVRIVRAYTYFEMVKRYGGIPLITKAQSINDPKSELFVKRNKEQEVYDFIGSEIDAVLNDLPSGDINRFTKYGALALKSRAMLYAGSIAKYGTVQLEGVVGIPSTLANGYFQASYNASKQIIPTSDGGSGGSVFSLYKAKIKAGDFSSYTDNFYNLFLTNKTSESIFEVDFIAGVKGNTASFYSGTAGSMMDPSLELANAFEMADGSSGVIDYANIAVSNVTDLHKNKDPRFNATILNDGDTWMGQRIYANWYIIKENGDKMGTYGLFYTGQNGVSLPSRGTCETWTGFSTKKLVRQIGVPNWGYDDVPCMVFRLGEIYLNCAEAALQLSNSADAIKYVNLIRERAGISLLSSIDMAKIKHERRVELAMGEAHRYWDLRRWRDAAKPATEGGLNGLYITKAQPYYDYRDGKYHFDVGRVEANARVFKEAYYYLPITTNRRNNNPNLVENPGY